MTMPSNPSASDAVRPAVATAAVREHTTHAAAPAPSSLTPARTASPALTNVPSLTIAPLQASMAQAVQHMTFPAYRHLLSLDANVRHPGDGDTRRVQPLGRVALIDDRPVGLALAERRLAAGDRPAAALLSLFVDASMRSRGIGTALVAALEEALAGSRPTRLEAVYMTGKSDVAAIERVFARRGWQPPAMRTYTLRFT